MTAEVYEYPISTAAKALQTTELNILMHIKRGKLSGIEKNGQWYLSRQSFDDFLACGNHAAADVISATHHCGHGCGGGCG